MRILVINYEYPPVGGGGGEVSKFLAEGFAARGHDVAVLTAHWKKLARREEVAPRLAIHRIRALRRDADRCTPPRMAAFMALAIPAALRLASRFKPDIVHCHFAIPSGPPALALRLFRHIPYVLTFHGGDVPSFVPDQTRLYYSLIKPLANRIARAAGRAVAVSEGLAAMARSDFKFDAIQCIPNGVDISIFAPDAARRGDGPIKIVSAGRFNPQKGLHRLIDACTQLQRLDAGDFSAQIFGGGPLESTLKGQAEALGLSHCLAFPGWVKREELAAALGAAHIFAMPSDIEGMPIACLQAMAAGCAIVGSRTVGIEEVVTDGENGILVPVGDVNALAQALRRLMGDRALLRRMGEAGRRIAVERYSWDAIVQQYLHVFENVLGR